MARRCDRRRGRHERPRLLGVWRPGHGKGVWDGLGALVKRTVKQDIIDGVALTSTKCVTSAAEVAEHVRAR